MTTQAVSGFMTKNPSSNKYNTSNLYNNSIM